MSIGLWQKNVFRWSFVLAIAFGTALMLSGSVFAAKGGGHGGGGHGGGGYGGGGYGGGGHGGHHMSGGYTGHGRGGQHGHRSSRGVYIGFGSSFGLGGYGYSGFGYSGYGGRGYGYGYSPIGYGGYGWYGGFGGYGGGSYSAPYRSFYATPGYTSYYAVPRYIYVQPSTANYRSVPGTPANAGPQAQSTTTVTNPSGELRPGMVLPDGAVVVSVDPIPESTPDESEALPTP